MIESIIHGIIDDLPDESLEEENIQPSEKHDLPEHVQPTEEHDLPERGQGEAIIPLEDQDKSDSEGTSIVIDTSGLNFDLASDDEGE